MKRKETPPKDLPRRDWYFLDCPKDEFADCWLYEFSRELGWLKDLVERRRGPITRQRGEQEPFQVQIDTLTGFARQSGYSFLLRPDWPAQPYLAAERKERKKWITWTQLPKRWHDPNGPGSRRTGKQERLDKQEFLADGLVAFEVPAGIEQELANALRDLGRPRVRSEDNLVELALIRIDWAKPDSQLQQEWDSYIKTFRPIGSSQ